MVKVFSSINPEDIARYCNDLKIMKDDIISIVNLDNTLNLYYFERESNRNIENILYDLEKEQMSMGDSDSVHGVAKSN